MFASISNLFVLILLAAIQIAQAAAQTPEYYGVYARNAGRLVRLEQDVKQVNRFDFSPDVTFVIYDKWVSQAVGLPMDQAVRISRMFFIRNHIPTAPLEGPNPRSPGPAKPVNAWGAEKFQGPLPVLIKPLAGKAEAIEVMPKDTLPPGVYLLRTLSSQFIFTVRFPDIETDDLCVDMYADNIGALLGEEARSYRKCDAARGVNAPQARPSENRTAPPREPKNATEFALAKLTEDVKDAALFDDHIKEFDYSGQKVWRAAYKVLNDRGKNITQANEDTGVIATDLAREGSFLGFYTLYFIFVEKTREASSRLGLRLFVYGRDPDRSTMFNNVLKPQDKSYVNRRADDFFADIKNSLRENSFASPESAKDVAPTGSVLAMIQDARKEYMAKNWKAAEAAYLKILNQDTENFEARAQLGSVYLRLGDFEKSKIYLQKAMNLRPEDSRPYYNMACTYAKMRETEGAIALLKQAVAKGFKDFEWMRRDPDLESVRNDPRFRNLTER
jgi:tetratricopeptide (TPR) repeat protein